MSARNDFQFKVKAQLERWDSDIEQLKLAADKVTGVAKTEFTQQLESLRTQQFAIRNQLASLLQASEDRWDELKRTIEASSAQLQQGIEQLRNKAQVATEEPLGWAEGIAHSRAHDSEGWVEGVGHKGPGSQGWAEGVGHLGEGSKGWDEGYPSE